VDNFRMAGAIRFRLLILLPLAFSFWAHGQAAPAGNNAGGASNSAASDVSGQLPPVIVQMLQTQIVWDNGLNHPTGPRLRFVKVDELTRPEGHFIRYRIYASGAAEGTPYILAGWTIGKSITDLNVISGSVYVNRKGLLLTRKPNPDEEDRDTVGPDAEYDLGVQAADGEPLRLVLRSPDNKVLMPGTLVPFPIEAADKNCKLSALLATPDGEAILIEGEGFQPNSQVLLQSNSAGEQRQSQKPVDASGHIQFVDLPYVIGKDAGELNDTISTKECTVSVIIPWGKGTYHPH
jgi:hypothetical protein